MLSEQIKEEALRLGFSFCGIARYEKLEHLRSFYESFLRNREYSTLTYLETCFEKRIDPSLLMKGIRSVIAVTKNYAPARVIPDTDNFIISRYAYGKDHHVVMRDRMDSLIRFMKHQLGNYQFRAYMDSGPVLEKAWAQKCGVGWQGKNTLIINKAAGSYFFLGIILSDLDLDPDRPETDRCGSCMKCMEACPTGALQSPYHLTIDRCISYHTIETKADIPDDIRKHLNHRIYGCDICQEVCPFNRFAKPHKEPEFDPSPMLLQMRKNEWVNLSEAQFDLLFHESAIQRTGYRKFLSNIRAANNINPI